MIQFAVRNLKIFFRDKASVFFSLLAVFIIIGMYALFLGDVWVGSMRDMKGTRFLMDSWIMAGLLSVTSVTTTMGAFGIMVEDKSKKILKDFISSPIKRSKLVGGYALGAFATGVLMSLVTLVLAELYILTSGGEIVSMISLLKIFGMIIISTFMNTAIIFLVVSFFTSSNAFATASTIIGTLIGFLTGIYLPIGQLPEAVQWVVKLFPVSHSAALFRQIMMAEPMAATFAGAPDSALNQFQQMMGVTLMIGDKPVNTITSLGIIFFTAILFYGLSILLISRKK